MSSVLSRVLFSGLFVASVTGCAGGSGDACQVNGDCSSSLVCCKSSPSAPLVERGMCASTCVFVQADAAVVDAAADATASDAMSVDAAADAEVDAAEEVDSEVTADASEVSDAAVDATPSDASDFDASAVDASDEDAD